MPCSMSLGSSYQNAPLRPQQVLERIRAEVYVTRLANAIVPGWANMQANLTPAVSGGYLQRCQPLSLAALVNKPAQIILLALNAEGQIALLYPAVNFKPHELSVKPANQSVAIAPDVFVTPPFGTDQLLVLAVDPSVPGLDGLSKQAAQLLSINSPFALAFEAYVKSAKIKRSCKC